MPPSTFEIWDSEKKTTATTTNLVIDPNGYTVGSETETITERQSHLTTSIGAPATTSTRTFTLTYDLEAAGTINTYVPSNLPSPSCQLPNTYSQCQIGAALKVIQYLSSDIQLADFSSYLSTPSCWKEWTSRTEAYYSTVYTSSPICSQAAVTGSLCSALKDAYARGQNGMLEVPGYGGVGGYKSNRLSQGWLQSFGESTWWWPTTQSFAPGCTLECGRCAVTGGSIELLFFPPGLSHPATGPVTASTLGTVLTSPTYYISFATVNASDACGAVGPTLTNTIVAVPTDFELSSVWGQPQASWIGGALQQTFVLSDTAFFNVTDILSTPVPASIRTSQVWCASSMFLNNDPKNCPESIVYHPQLVVPDAFLQSLDPAWVSCSADLRGLFDPPKPLTMASSAAGPTTPAVQATGTMPASPASVQTTPFASQTAESNMLTTTSSLASSVLEESTSASSTEGQSTKGTDIFFATTSDQDSTDAPANIESIEIISSSLEPAEVSSSHPFATTNTVGSASSDGSASHGESTEASTSDSVVSSHASKVSSFTTSSDEAPASAILSLLQPPTSTESLREQTLTSDPADSAQTAMGPSIAAGQGTGSDDRMTTRTPLPFSQTNSGRSITPSIHPTTNDDLGISGSAVVQSDPWDTDATSGQGTEEPVYWPSITTRPSNSAALESNTVSIGGSAITLSDGNVGGLGTTSNVQGSQMTDFVNSGISSSGAVHNTSSGPASSPQSTPNGIAHPLHYSRLLLIVGLVFVLAMLICR
ncbi:hypothetical protein LTR56_020032 [Elasticomyces elasticus]|nr:hypothetical protein LTR56_020032 [Elasticomyces elasticus]KAK3634167.1 hypothetical protein LTR22_019776 [Elasticomyces elasticus]KAK4911210.1 hypothetical protein LTR49_020176 [Elasticomyces elasticus]KAK5750689.1 hypothetical protein LTS12_019220 [Elasticomyces elasticus]